MRADVKAEIARTNQMGIECSHPPQLKGLGIVDQQRTQQADPLACVAGKLAHKQWFSQRLNVESKLSVLIVIVFFKSV
jgi:hypothetical protein